MNEWLSTHASIVRLKIVLRILLLLLLTYSLLRITFGMLYFNARQFDWAEYFRLFYWGFRMDYAALFYINLPFLIFFFFPSFLFSKYWQVCSSLILLSFTNLPFIALNVIDLQYYKYNFRRSTVDIFYSMPASIHSFGSLFWQYWYLLFAFLVLSSLIMYLSFRALNNLGNDKIAKPHIAWLSGVGFVALSFLIARGWQSRPIVPSTPLLYFHPSVQPLVNNSAINFLYSYIHFTSGPERKNYFSEPQLDSIFTIRRQYADSIPFNKRNVVVFVLESFSEKYFLDGPHKAVTPFFDSLRSKSVVCTSAFQNGHESVKGLLSILASVPPFLDQPLFVSNYNTIPFKGIGTILRDNGYNCNFFLGAEYDHFNFGKLCRMTGIDHYYSKENYGKPGHDDGNWGIYDEYFFDYFANKVSGFEQPHFSVLYNISSHPPFAIPGSRESQFDNPIRDKQYKSISYVDYCFSQLFQKIKTQPWFENSIFVFVSDHTFLKKKGSDLLLHEILHIPLFVYDPQKPVQRKISKVVQQMDVVPTILDMLHYPKPFMSFGNSILRNDGGYAVFNILGPYQLIDSATITAFDEPSNKVLYRYNWLTDSSPGKNLMDDTLSVSKERTIKAILQRFNNSLLDRTLLTSE